MKKNTRGISVFGRKVGNFFLLIIATIFAALVIYCLLLFFAPDTFAGMAENFSPPDYKGAGIAVLISVGIMVILFLWLKHYVEKRTRKDNIGELRLLNRMLFDTFNSLLKKDGLLEEAWKHSSSANNKLLKSLFWNTLVHARKTMEKEKLEDLLVDFELFADNIQSEDFTGDAKVIANCEKDGFKFVVSLIGSDFATKFGRVESAINAIIFHLQSSCGDKPPEEFFENFRNILLFKWQLDRAWESLSHGKERPKESPGLLADINTLSVLVFLRSKVELN